MSTRKKVKTGMANVEILRTTGQREEHEVGMHILLPWIRRMIGAEETDQVNLLDGRVMIVDDHGWETETVDHGDRIELKPVKARKPVNEEATRIYLARCRPGATHQIVGDVAIAWDEDFA